ncbi:hypothetical protein EDD30_2694 [Couchioplanes caeruleus]|uniref:Uncharacterized protein n=1 Tax=Couchioplanes caeruleus TaxID=56438 RepID=A0A3N1GIE1_9ACTN|nr:hypothetical protein EDD30_2694 [Couchioplanes caeruleus]
MEDDLRSGRRTSIAGLPTPPSTGLPSGAARRAYSSEAIARAWSTSGPGSGTNIVRR